MIESTKMYQISDQYQFFNYPTDQKAGVYHKFVELFNQNIEQICADHQNSMFYQQSVTQRKPINFSQAFINQQCGRKQLNSEQQTTKQKLSNMVNNLKNLYENNERNSVIEKDEFNASKDLVYSSSLCDHLVWNMNEHVEFKENLDGSNLNRYRNTQFDSNQVRKVLLAIKCSVGKLQHYCLDWIDAKCLNVQGLHSLGTSYQAQRDYYLKLIKEVASVDDQIFKEQSIKNYLNEINEEFFSKILDARDEAIKVLSKNSWLANDAKQSTINWANSNSKLPNDHSDFQEQLDQIKRQSKKRTVSDSNTPPNSPVSSCNVVKKKFHCLPSNHASSDELIELAKEFFGKIEKKCSENESIDKIKVMYENLIILLKRSSKFQTTNQMQPQSASSLNSKNTQEKMTKNSAKTYASALSADNSPAKPKSLPISNVETPRKKVYYSPPKSPVNSPRSPLVNKLMNSAKKHRQAAIYSKAKQTWFGDLPPISANDENASYSAKAFFGGIPWSVTNDQFQNAFNQYGQIIFQWPGTDVNYTAGGNVAKAGYVYGVFENSDQVRKMLADCAKYDDRGNFIGYFKILKARQDYLRQIKKVEIKPWNINDSYYCKDETIDKSKLKTLFVGNLHGQMTAYALAIIFDDLFHDVVSVTIDTDKNDYPTGSAMIAVSSNESYLKAIKTAFVLVNCSNLNFHKKLQIDPFVEDAECSTCEDQHGMVFCRDTSCLNYYCPDCFINSHDNEKMKTHIPIIKKTRDD